MAHDRRRHADDRCARRRSTSDGTVAAPAIGRCAWRVHAGDRWIDPATEPAVACSRAAGRGAGRARRRCVSPAATRSSGCTRSGDDGGVVVIEVENDSPEGDRGRVRVVGRAHGPTACWRRAGRRPGAVEDDGAVVFPVPHRTSGARRARATRAPTSTCALADADAVTRGVGSRARPRHAHRAARAVAVRGRRGAAPTCLLAPPSAAAFVALEAWGFDDEAVAMWARLGMRDRRRRAGAARRTAACSATMRADARARRPATTIELVARVSAPAWLGQTSPCTTRRCARARCSFAVRWHGARPALLWDVPAGDRCARPRSIPRGRRPSRPARRCWPSRRRAAGDGARSARRRRRRGRRAGAVLVTDDERARRRPRRRRAVRPRRARRRGRRLELLDFLVDEVGASIPELVQRRRAGRAPELRRVPHAARRARRLHARRGGRAGRASIRTSR